MDSRQRNPRGNWRHFAVSPDDPDVINGFLSRLNAQNSTVSATPQHSSGQSQASVQSSSPSSNQADPTVAALQPPVATQASAYHSGVGQISAPAPATSEELPPTESTAFPGSDEMKGKGLGASKWTQATFPEAPPPSTTRFSPNAEKFVPSSFRSGRELADVSNDRSNTSRPTNQKPEDASSSNTRFFYWKRASETPGPDSMFADTSESEALRARQETLERKVRETKAIKERIRKEFLQEVAAAAARADEKLEASGLEKPSSSTTHVTTPSFVNENVEQDQKTTPEPVLPSRSKYAPSPLQQVYTPDELLSASSPYKNPEKLMAEFQREVEAELSANPDATVASLLEKMSISPRTQSTSSAPSAPATTKDSTSVPAVNEQESGEQPCAEPRATVAAWNEFAQSEQKKDAGDSEGQLFFKSYPKPEKREGGPALPRRVIISNLSPTSTTKSVASMVFGGALEEIRYTKGSSTAHVIFLSGGEATRFFDETANGIPCGGERLRVAFVDMDDQPLPLSGIMKQHIANGVTRCVRVIGIDNDPAVLARLADKAQGVNAEKEIESIAAKQLKSEFPYIRLNADESMRTQTHAAEIRFCSMKDAHAFFGGLRFDENWEHCNVQYAPDPCSEREAPVIE